MSKPFSLLLDRQEAVRENLARPKEGAEDTYSIALDSQTLKGAEQAASEMAQKHKLSMCVLCHNGKHLQGFGSLDLAIANVG